MKPSASVIAKEHFLMLIKIVISAESQGELCKVEVLKCQDVTTKAKVKLPLFAGDFLELALDVGAPNCRSSLNWLLMLEAQNCRSS